MRRPTSRSKRDKIRAEYGDAEKLLSYLRRVQRESGTVFKGTHPLKEGRVSYIETVRGESGLIKTIAETYEIRPNTLYKLMARFEELADRRKVEVPHHLRATIYKRLAVEFAGNIEFLTIPPEQYDAFIGVTLLNGNINNLPDLHVKGDPAQPTYAEYFEDNLSVFKVAARGNPGDPQRYLNRIVDTVKDLPSKHIKDDPRLPTYGDYFTGYESVFKRAAAAKNPEKFLGRIVTTITALPRKHVHGDKDKPTYRRFFKGNEGIFIHAAVHNPASTETFLNKVAENATSLPTRHIRGDRTLPTYGEYFTEFDFTEHEWVFMHAARGYPDNPAAFLDSRIDVIASLERAYPQSTRKERIHAAFDRPRNPASHLKESMEARGARHQGRS